MHVAEILPGKQIELLSLVVSSDDKTNFDGQGTVWPTDDADYDTVHNEAGTFVTNYNKTHTIGQRYNLGGEGKYQVFRCVMRFDLTDLPVGATITSAVLTALAGYVFHYTEWDIVLVDGSDCADPIVAADYGDLLDDVTSLGSVVVSTITGFTTFTITLNAAGRALLESKAGSVAVLGVRSSDDISSTPPAGDYDAGEKTDAQFAIISTTDYPYITITYTE